MYKRIFNIIYAIYEKKDYFGNKEYIKKMIEYGKTIQKYPKPGEVKNFLKIQKEKTYKMIIKRIAEAKEKGTSIYPQREKFTHSIFKTIGL